MCHLLKGRLTKNEQKFHFKNKYNWLSFSTFYANNPGQGWIPGHPQASLPHLAFTSCPRKASFSLLRVTDFYLVNFAVGAMGQFTLPGSSRKALGCCFQRLWRKRTSCALGLEDSTDLGAGKRQVRLRCWLASCRPSETPPVMVHACCPGPDQPAVPTGCFLTGPCADWVSQGRGTCPRPIQPLGSCPVSECLLDVNGSMSVSVADL